MLVRDSIPNLINGISQQPNSLRLPTQAEIQENLYSSVVEGLSDRPPTEYITKLFPGTIGDALQHTINRDVTERYNVLFRQNEILVHTLDGVQKTVTYPAGTSYLNTTTPSTSLKAFTAQDHTFVINKDVPVRLDPLVTPIRNKEAIVFVKAGNYGSTYRININGVQKADFTTSTTDVLTLKTEEIALNLYNDLLASLAGLGYTLAIFSSIIHISRTSDFSISVVDSQGGASMQVFKDSTPNFTSLPTIAPTGFQLKIVGQPGSNVDDHYVKFVPAKAGDTFGEGHWEETVAMGIQYKLDASTMPHLLIRQADGTFTFERANWNSLTAGDLTTAPPPSFVGQKLTEAFLFKNRLHFLTKDIIAASESAQYFNFWPTSVITKLDSDRIDVAVSHVKAINLQHAIPFDEKALLFSDQTQFILQGGQTYTAETIKVDATTEVENSRVCRPIASDKNVYFCTPNESFHGVREYHIDRTTGIKDALDVTAHVPKYIPEGAFRMLASNTQNILGVLTTGDQRALYMYKYFYAGDEKLQSSWSRMYFGDANTKILGGDFIEARAYLAIQRADGVYLEKLNFSPGVTDPDTNYVTHYDRRITEDQCVSVSYTGGQTRWILPYQIEGDMRAVTRGAGGTVTTSTTVIHTPPGTSGVSSRTSRFSMMWLGFSVDAVPPSPHGTIGPEDRRPLLELYISGGGGSSNFDRPNRFSMMSFGSPLEDGSLFPNGFIDSYDKYTSLGLFFQGSVVTVEQSYLPGQTIPLVYQAGNEVRANGDHTWKEVYLGQKYQRRYRFSHIYLRDAGKDGKPIILVGRLQLRTLTIGYADTSTFSVTVTPDFRDPNAYTVLRDPADTTFTGRILGAGSNLLGAIALSTGRLTVPILSKNDQVTIEITTDDYGPIHLLSADWEGTFHTRARGR